ncbi:uncharacterized protein CC84DRAFT_1203097 [Paraphaeosphaeria sporulosa]|uniref:ABM domain-containing protein n=1 Tax=Paraphaeosphaeria sporulosa TaxID=1460663 RepID=A0A177CV44_9PLEO|nr:uncharacterized protein CC84DRAFT_1203097 [Paraphaeosphaeria sporulosa]OAG10740.1 hypothetical protein CC84DRAFT_1203097 [Paraphaeosphaeria sporulosa]
MPNLVVVAKLPFASSAAKETARKEEGTYTSRAAFDAHMSIDPVKDMVGWLTSNPQNIDGEATVTISENYASFTRPEVLKVADPWICYASIEYKEGKRAEALEPWKHVTSETEKNETETLSYSILKDTGHPETIKTIEVYPSQEYFKEVHVPSEAVQENAKKYGNEIRLSLAHVFLRYQAGFLGR